MTTFLTAVNAVLNRTSITSASGGVSSLTNVGKQVYIDTIVQIWNETIDDACNMMGLPHVGETASGSLTLVLDQREYDLPSDLVQIRWPLVDHSLGHFIWEYPGGYVQMRVDQFIPADWLGLAYTAVINPTTQKLRLDRAPSADEVGAVYDLLYDKDLVMSEDTDTVPFSEAVFRALTPVVTEVFERRNRNDFDEAEYRRNMARALAFMNKTNRRPHW